MAKAVLDHATGADPMPMNGTRYTKEQWDDMRNNWLKNNSMVKVAKSEIAAIEEQVKSYVQKAGREFDERYALFDSGIAGNKSVFTYLGQVICDYRSELYSGYRSDTPEPTIDGFERVKRRVESYCKNSIAKAQLFNDPELYKLGNAQYVIESVNRWKASNPDNYLSDRMVLSLLETYHGIPVDDPRTLSKNTPDGIVIHVKDLLAGTKTVQDCLNREAARTKARNQEKQESQQALVDLLTKAHEILKDKPHTEDFKTKAVNLLRKAGLEVGVRFSGSMAISSGRSFYTAHDEKFPYSTLCFKLAPELSKQKEVLAGKSYKELESDAVLSARASLKAKKENTSSTDYEAEVVVATKRLKPLADAANESTTLQEFTNKYREYLDTPSSYYRNTVSSGRGALRGDRLVEDAMLAYGMDIPDKGFAANFYEKIKTLKSSDEKIPIENTSNTASEAQTWLDEVVEAISKDYDLVESSHYKKDYADAELPSYYIARINVAARKASVKSSFKTGLLEFQRLSNEVTQGKTTLAAVIHNIIKDKPLPDTAEPDAQPWTLPYEEWNKLENKGKYGYLNIDEWRNEVGKAVANGESVSNDIAQQGSLNYIPTEKLSSIFGRFISDIPNSTAANAHRGTSFSSDTRAKQEQVSYALYMSSIEKKLLDFAQTEDEKAIAHTEFEHIREKYRSMTLGMLQSRSGLLSAMIAGPAGMGKYKRRNEKADRAFRSKVESMSEYMPKAIARAKKAIRPETSAIRTDTPDALNLAKKKLDDLVKDQERMKAINKIIRSGKNVKERLMSEFNYKSAQVDELLEPDFGGRIGFPNYMLTNNNANIRRMQERLKELESVSKEIDREFSFEGGKVVVDTDDMRIRIIYDSIPSKEAREKLKGRGFKWSPSNSAWQRQLTDNAKYAVQVVTGINVDIPSVMPKSFDTLSDAAPSDEEENAKLDDDLAALEPKYDSAIQSANQSVFKRTWSIVRC